MSNKWAGETKQHRHDREGFSNPAIYTFAGNKVGGFVREMIQNSLDAGDRINSKSVGIKITKKLIEKSDFPNFEQWNSIVQTAISEHKTSTDGTAIHRGIQEDLRSHGGRIPVLVYEDFNTPGLSGTHDSEGTFNALVRSKGTSDHGDVSNPGGSFGIGKGAAWSMSKARTVIFSSRHETDGLIIQGIAELASHTINNQLHGAKVYFGQDDDECSSIREVDVSVSSFVRNEIGLSQFIMFPHLESDWKEAIEESLLRNYWPALQNEMLEIQLLDTTIGSDTPTIISKSNLSNRLVAHFDTKDFRNVSNTKPEGNPLNFWQTYCTGKLHLENIASLGKTSIKVRLNDENQTSGLCYIRRGMVIDVNRKRMHGYGDMRYCATIECLDEEGNQLLRMMEPPTHDEFSLDIIETRKGKSARKKASKALRDIAEPIKKFLDTSRAELLSHTDHISWVDELFNSVDSSTGARSRGDTGEKSETETPKRMLGEIAIQSISFNSDGANRAFMRDLEGIESLPDGGSEDRDGSGKKMDGAKSHMTGRNDIGGGTFEGRRNKKSPLPHRIFASRLSEKESEYTIITARQESSELISVLLCQRGDVGKVVAFNLIDVKNTQGQSLKFQLENDKGYVIHDVPANGKISIIVNEGHKSNYILTDRTS